MVVSNNSESIIYDCLKMLDNEFENIYHQNIDLY